MKRWRAAFFLITIIWGFPLLPAGADGDIGPLFVGLRAETYVDTTGALTIDAVASLDFGDAFSPNGKKHFSFGLSPHAHWIRFRPADLLPKMGDHDSRWQFYFNYASFYDIRLYHPVCSDHACTWVVQEGGIRYGSERDGTGFVFPLFDLPREVALDQDFYIRVQGPFTANFQLVLTEKPRFEERKLRIVLFLALVFGIMVAMLFYNLVLFLILKDRNYLLYVLYLAFMILYQAAIAGIVQIVDLSVADFLTTHVVLLCFLAMGSHILFAWSFLDVPQKAPGMRNVYRAIWLVCALGILFSVFARVYQANVMAYAAGMLLPFILVVTVAISYRNGHRVSKYYLLAVCMLLASVVIFAIRGFGLIEHSIYTSYSVLLAAALESLLFSFALADRISRLQKKHYRLLLREKELAEISITDELTGLYNRRHFDRMLRHCMEYARATGEPLSMVLMDIDHFKAVNDRFGHQAGDEVLRALGGIIRKDVRTSDYPCRIGGEEIAVLMLDAGVSDAGSAAERIRQEFEMVRFDAMGSDTVSATISLGVTAYRPGESGHTFFQRADQALYRAKAEGRNRAVIDGSSGKS